MAKGLVKEELCSDDERLTTVQHVAESRCQSRWLRQEFEEAKREARSFDQSHGRDRRQRVMHLPIDANGRWLQARPSLPH